MPAVAAAPIASLNAGIVTSQIPTPTPAGSEVRASVRTPGDASAPSGPGRPGRTRSGSGSIARDGGSAVNVTVPTITLTADTISAAGGESTVAIRAVSSGPMTKITWILTVSSA